MKSANITEPIHPSGLVSPAHRTHEESNSLRTRVNQSFDDASSRILGPTFPALNLPSNPDPKFTELCHMEGLSHTLGHPCRPSLVSVSMPPLSIGSQTHSPVYLASSIIPTTNSDPLSNSNGYQRLVLPPGQCIASTPATAEITTCNSAVTSTENIHSISDSVQLSDIHSPGYIRCLSMSSTASGGDDSAGECTYDEVTVAASDLDIGSQGITQMSSNQDYKSENEGEERDSETGIKLILPEDVLFFPAILKQTHRCLSDPSDHFLPMSGHVTELSLGDKVEQNSLDNHDSHPVLTAEMSPLPPICSMEDEKIYSNSSVGETNSSVLAVDENCEYPAQETMRCLDDKRTADDYRDVIQVEKESKCPPSQVLYKFIMSMRATINTCEAEANKISLCLMA
ncbi:unnamed protein product [Protopolystoma xenopodis]|uniref:Uncharacterized protein n=1 Tax=Protopolystoma xenopodis TaxID=117903 RepID=A0A448X6T2_9PLAT|nr:unnamed protein product [Protopolystoma xenopodis]